MAIQIITELTLAMHYNANVISFRSKVQKHALKVLNLLEWRLKSTPKAHAFVSLPLQSGFFIRLVLSCYIPLKKFYIKNCAIWAERQIILKAVWKNVLDNKHIIVACLFMSIIFKGFVKWCLLSLGFSILLIILWLGLFLHQKKMICCHYVNY